MNVNEMIDKAIKGLDPTLDEGMVDQITAYLREKGPTIIENLDHIVPYFEAVQKRNEAFVKEKCQHMSPEEQKKELVILNKMSIEGKSFAEATGVTKQNLETFFSIAYNYYNSGKYKEALLIFNVLTVLDFKQPRYHFGLAATHHMLKNYEDALVQYVQTLSFEPLNPIPWFHMADCYLHLKKFEEAANALQNVIEAAKFNPVLSPLKEKSQLILNKINIDLKRESKG